MLGNVFIKIRELYSQSFLPVNTCIFSLVENVKTVLYSDGS